MWTCSNCREVIEEQFDSCWKCGCSREGKLNLDFMAEPANGEDETSFEFQFKQAYRCQKCKHREARVERISTTGTGFSKIVKRNFLAVSCDNCGWTEFYNLAVLEGRSDIQSFLRGLFGM